MGGKLADVKKNKINKLITKLQALKALRGQNAERFIKLVQKHRKKTLSVATEEILKWLEGDERPVNPDVILEAVREAVEADHASRGFLIHRG